MNERIRELAEQAIRIEESDELFPREVFDREKFAELIVKECAQVANDSNQSKNRATGVSVGDVVRKHFGVE